MTEEEKIAKILKDGHMIADKIKAAQTISEVDNLTKEIKEFSDFADENFGIVDDFDNRLDCELSTFLFIALDWKKRTLQPENYDNEATSQLAERYMTDYIEFLDSREWAISSYGKKLQ